MEIVYEDEELIVIHKEAGLAAQTADIRTKDCVSLIMSHLSSSSGKKGQPYVGVIHRLDQPVEGLLVFAKNQKSAANLSKAVTGDMMTKKYHAKVEGRLTSDELLCCNFASLLDNGGFCLKNYIYKDSAARAAVIVNCLNEKSTNEKVREANKAKEAVLELFICGYDESEDITDVDIILKTGRFHQIRAQMANIGHPIAGDKKYGATKEYKPHAIALAATDLTFIHPRTGKKMSFSLNQTGDKSARGEV